MEGGDIGLYVTLVPYVLYPLYIIRWLNNLGYFLCILTLTDLGEGGLQDDRNRNRRR